MKVRLYVGLGLVAAAAVLAITGTATLPPSKPSAMVLANRAERITGYIHTFGTGIYDQTGRRVRLLGIDSSTLAGGPPTTACPNSHWSAITSTEIGDEASWGFNEVRIAISWADLEPTPPSGGVHHWDPAYVAAVSGAVRAYNQAGIAVVLDLHEVEWSPAFNQSNSGITKECQGTGAPAWLYPDASSGLSVDQAICNFYNNVSEPGVSVKPQDGLAEAERYLAGYFSPGKEAAHGQVIAFDMLNEPKPVTGTSCAGHVGADMLGVYQKVGSSIRSVDPPAALIYEDYAFESYETVGFMLSAPLDMSNAIYSGHAYPATWDEPVPASCAGNKPWPGLPFYDAHLKRSTAFGQPLWIGEFNAFATQSSCPDPNWQADATSLMSFDAGNDVSWSFWDYKDLASHPAALPYLQTGFGASST